MNSFLQRYAPIISILKWAGLIVLVVFLVVLWRKGSQQDQVIAKAKHDSAAADKKIAGYEQDIKAINAKAKAANDALELEKKKPATVKTVQTYVPIPGQFVLVDSPGQPQYIEITGDPQQNLDALQNFGVDSRECKNSLLACNAALDKKQKELDVMTGSRDEWRNAANGGNKWARTKKGLKVDLGAVSGAALGALIDRKHPVRGAAIGAGAGTLGVQIFW